MPARRLPLALGLGFVLLAGYVLAQQPSPDAATPVFRVTTRLVVVDVVVTDKQGKPVMGLKPEDFAVQENGKAQKVSLFVPPGQNLPPAPAALPPNI